MIHAESLTFSYPDQTFQVRLPALKIAQGKSVALVGPSGSGKTTLINLMAGILLPDAGKITTSEVELTSLNEADRKDLRIVRMGLIFQEFELLDYLNVQENILLPYRINSVLNLDENSKTRAKQLAGRVGLGDKLKKYPGNLSQGERQRVAVCRALVTDPKILLCDEPTANLDPENRNKILDIIFSYATETQTTLVIVTHDYEILERFDEVMDMKTLVQS